MRYGIFDHLDYPGGNQAAHYAQSLALIKAYDEAGFYGYHLAEHHGTDLGLAPSPGIFLAAAAQHSSRLRLGALVFCLPFYQPVRLLAEICMLDQLTGGRLEFGVGRGISPIEAGYFGYQQPGEALSVYRESYELILAGLKGGELNFEGQHYQVKDMPMVLQPVQRPHPPLWIGASGPDGLEWPARNGINLVANLPSHRMRAVTDRYREIWAEEGNDPEALPLIAITRYIVIAEDGEEAREIGRRAYRPWRQAFMRLWDRHGIPLPNFTLPDDFDTYASAGQACAGTPDEVAAYVAEQVELSGVNYFLCRFAFGDISLKEAQRSVDLFRQNVM